MRPISEKKIMLWIKRCDFRTQCHWRHTRRGSGQVGITQNQKHTHTHRMKIITIIQITKLLDYLNVFFATAAAAAVVSLQSFWLAYSCFARCNESHKRKEWDIEKQECALASAQKWFSLAKILMAILHLNNKRCTFASMFIVWANRRFVDLVEWLFLLSSCFFFISIQQTNTFGCRIVLFLMCFPHI